MGRRSFIKMATVNAFLKGLPVILAGACQFLRDKNIFFLPKKRSIKFGTEFAVVVVSIRYQLTFITNINFSQHEH